MELPADFLSLGRGSVNREGFTSIIFNKSVQNDSSSFASNFSLIRCCYQILIQLESRTLK